MHYKLKNYDANELTKYLKTKKVSVMKEFCKKCLMTIKKIILLIV